MFLTVSVCCLLCRRYTMAFDMDLYERSVLKSGVDVYLRIMIICQ